MPTPAELVDRLPKDSPEELVQEVIDEAELGDEKCDFPESRKARKSSNQN